MNRDRANRSIEPRALLSTLWIFVLLNMLFRDIHELFRPGMLEQMISGTVNGTEITPVLMLVGGVMLELAIVMVLLSRVLPYRINRWANIGVGVITLGFVFAYSTAPDLDDLFFTAVESVALVIIVGTAWRWSERNQPSTSFYQSLNTGEQI